MPRRPSSGNKLWPAIEAMYLKFATDQQKEEYSRMTPDEQGVVARTFLVENSANPDPDIQREKAKILKRFGTGRRPGWY
jgi:hypothetical protein